MKCADCGSELKKDFETLNYKGRSITIDVKRCMHCDTWYSHAGSLDKVQRKLIPTFFQRIIDFIR